MSEIKTNRGFTIVELLIVIVVIAILATIAIVSFNGIQGRAHDTAVQNDLANLMKKFELYRIDKGTYPLSNIDLESMDVRVTKSSYLVAPDTNYNLVPCLLPGGDTIAITAISKSRNRYYISTDSGAVKPFESSSVWTDEEGYWTPCADVLPGSGLPVGTCNAIGFCGSWKAWLNEG